MGRIATPQEFIDAYERLDEKERIGMLAAARRYTAGDCGFQEAEDLVNELFVRVIDGKRNWSVDVPLMAFLVLGFKSVANGGRRLARNKLPHLSLDACRDEPDLRLHLAANPHPSAEDAFSEHQEREVAWSAIEFARRSLAGDRLALQVLDGMVNDMTPAETGAYIRASKAEVHAARERVRVRLATFAERQARKGNRRAGEARNGRFGRTQ